MTVPQSNSLRHDCPSIDPRHADLYVRTLHRACEKLGGIGPLAHHLDVSAITVARWLDGRVSVPRTAFLKAVDVPIG